MSRQILLTEIERLCYEEGESKENLRDEIYALDKYPGLAHLFQQYKTDGERWHQIVREVLFCDKEDIRYMYNRIMLILRRFKLPKEKYFEVSSATGTYLLPDRLSDLNRLLDLYQEFFYEIFPQIIKELNFNVFTKEIVTKVVSGNVRWDLTLMNAIRKGMNITPIEFNTVYHEPHFDTSENLVLVLAILRLRQDAMLIRKYRLSDKLQKEEIAILNNIIDGCNNTLNNSLLKILVPKVSKYLLFDSRDPRVMYLESAAVRRLRERKIRHKTYARLFEWVKKYRELNIRSISPIRTNFPIDRRENFDTMFEVWVLCEFLDYLAVQHGAVIRAITFPQSFQITIHRIELTLFYEKQYKGWALNAYPDFTIEKEGSLKVVMDAKNWLESKSDAMYKMLGYLNNLDATLGILFYPNSHSLPKEPIIFAEDLKNHKNQCLINFVIEPFSTQESVRNRQETFDSLHDIIIDVIRENAMEKNTCG